MHELKSFKYYGGEEKLAKDDSQKGFWDHEEFKRFLEERAKKHKDFRQSLAFINRNKRNKWIQSREVKHNKLEPSVDKLKAKDLG